MQATSRMTDPLTSHAAATTAERTGQAQRQRDTCLNQVRSRPGLTAAEIAGFAGLERHVPSRRLPELRRAGLVTNGETRTCAVMGSRAMTWEPQELASKQAPPLPKLLGEWYERRGFFRGPIYPVRRDD